MSEEVSITATDRFAHEFVRALAEKSGYQPSHCPLEDYLYRDCTGQLTSDDFLQLRMIEKGLAPLAITPEFAIYVKNMRLFVQYVTLRYRSFLAECEVRQDGTLHTLILRNMLSEKMKDLCQYLDEVQDGAQGFCSLFKTPAY